ncbi:MAG TPA: hypothetical protein ENI95_10225 [Chloroflexi bacterium]|nr:hypothetical protein [Chloroflexota bacterium]
MSSTEEYLEESKTYPGHKVRRPGSQVSRWFAPWKRGLGTWGFVLNRVAGLGLVLYLFLHLAVLSLLTRGQEGWDAFITLAKSPLFLLLDVVLLAGILGHGLNGLRVALIGTGLLVRWHRPLFIAVAVIAVLGLVAGALLFFSA